MKRYSIPVGALLVSAALAGCSSSSGDVSQPSNTKYTLNTPAATAEIDTLKWGVAGSEPASLDWIYDWDYGPSNLIEANLCEGLTRQNPDGTTTPALAADVQTPNATTYVYDLRSDVTFTDGSPLTADDVAFSLNRNLTASPPSYWGLWYQNVKSITVTGASQVTVKLKTPDSLFPSVMSTPAGYVGEKAYIQKEGSKYGTAAGGVMCTGPFSLQSWDKGQSITLARNDNYWDKDLEPKAKSVVFSFIPDASAMTSALMTGEIDGASGMDVSTLNALQKSTTGKLYVNEGTEVAVMQLNDLTEGPLQDVRIRQALRDVIDYDGITKGVLDGYAEPVKSSTPPTTYGYAKSTWQAGYDSLAGGKQDLDAAQQLVTDAGAPSDPIVIGVASDNQSVVNVATAIQASAKQIGLNVEVKKFPASEFANLFYDPKARAGVDVLMNTVTADVPDPLELLAQVVPGSPYNYTQLKDDEQLNKTQQATAAADAETRANLGVQVEKIIDDKVYSIALYSLDARVYLNNDVTGAPVSSLSQWYYPWAATVGKS